MKKFFSLVVSGIISTLLLCSCNTSPSKPLEIENLSLTFPRVINTGKAQLDNLKYNDNWFLESPYTYNEDLALTSMILNFSDLDPESLDTYPETIKINESLGFHKESTEVIKSQEDKLFTFPFTISSKKFKTEDGTLKSLVAVNLRYGGYGNGGWKTDFAIGPGLADTENEDNLNYHLGFYESAKFVTNAVVDYLDTNKFDLPNTKIWLTGYSKGAGISDVASILLRENPNIDVNNIFTYSAATPAFTTITEKDPSLDNIHNLLNYSDIATIAPFTEWGFTCAGHNVFIPTVNESNKAKFNEIILKISGIDYIGLYDYTDILNNFKSIITKRYPTREAYGLKFQPIIENLLSDIDEEFVTSDFSYFDKIFSCDNTVVGSTIQEIKDYLSTLDLSSTIGQLLAVSYVDGVLETAKNYWVNQESIYGDILTSLLDLLKDAVKIYISSSDPDNPEDYLNVQTIQAIKEFASLGKKAPICYQHYPELYVSRLLLNK